MAGISRLRSSCTSLRVGSVAARGSSECFDQRLLLVGALLSPEEVRLSREDGNMRSRKFAVLIAVALLCGLVVVPAGTAGAIRTFRQPGKSPGHLRQLWKASVQYGPRGHRGWPFRMDTGDGTGDGAGGKVFHRAGLTVSQSPL